MWAMIGPGGGLAIYGVVIGASRRKILRSGGDSDRGLEREATARQLDHLFAFPPPPCTDHSAKLSGRGGRGRS